MSKGEKAITSSTKASMMVINRTRLEHKIRRSKVRFKMYTIANANAFDSPIIKCPVYKYFSL